MININTIFYRKDNQNLSVIIELQNLKKNQVIDVGVEFLNEKLIRAYGQSTIMFAENNTILETSKGLLNRNNSPSNDNNEAKNELLTVNTGIQESVNTDRQHIKKDHQQGWSSVFDESYCQGGVSWIS
jgi:hypothetical protein